MFSPLGGELFVKQSGQHFGDRSHHGMWICEETGGTHFKVAQIQKYTPNTRVELVIDDVYAILKMS